MRDEDGRKDTVAPLPLIPLRQLSSHQLLAVHLNTLLLMVMMVRERVKML